MIMSIHVKLMEQLSHGRIRREWYHQKDESILKLSQRSFRTLLIIRVSLIYDLLRRQPDPP